MGNILEVKRLQISFRTPGGILKAVRDISFDLEKGETLAIVGESGSGKSVTSKAILGILAGNSIVDSGEILYDGKDLLSINEDEMYKIRGDKISMIFQDPLSSLNPIVKIGKQITEAMILKNKSNRKAARKSFNSMLRELENNMIAASGGENASPESVNEIKTSVKTFDTFNIKAIELEDSYNKAHNYALELIADIDDFIFLAEKKQKLDVKLKLSEFRKKLGDVKDSFLTHNYDDKIAQMSQKIGELRAGYKQVKGAKDKAEANIVPAEIIGALNDTRALLVEITEQERPIFFRIGYYLLDHPQSDLIDKSVGEMNEFTLNYLNDKFMNRFLELEGAGVEYSFNRALEEKKAVLPELEAAKKYLSTGNYTKAEALQCCNALADKVEASIDRLEFVKDSAAYTFRSALSKAIEKYFHYVKMNPKEEERFAKQTKKREALLEKGKNVDWKVVPKNVIPLEDLIENEIVIIDRLAAKYDEYIANAPSVNMPERSVALIDYFKEQASQVVYKVTKRMAREKAIKLMEEVGIPEPRIRFNQYPFEFSGGMRQRIVIAIALAANPDILICDEPTTALDVTIQAQILELINNLKKERHLSVIFITHDLGVVANMADKIAVMYAGKIVEYGTADDIFYDPKHPYTWALLSSMPDLDTSDKLDAIPGTPPNMIYPPVGDAFAERNKYALDIDFEQQPPKFRVSDTHWAATWLLHPSAPHVDMPKIIKDRIERMKEREEAAQAAAAGEATNG